MDEFSKAEDDARRFGTGYIKIECNLDGSLNAKHINPEDIFIKTPTVLQCPNCLLGGEWKVNGKCFRCGE